MSDETEEVNPEDVEELLHQGLELVRQIPLDFYLEAKAKLKREEQS